MALEHIFDDIGGFSRFQMLLIVWVYTIKFMMGWSTLLLSYASFSNEYACVVDSVFNQSSLENMEEPEVWRLAEQGINNESLVGACEVGGSSCQQFYFFGTKRTITSEWDLVCDRRWLKATITSIQFGGVLAGAVIGGQSGDYFGRKKTLYGSYLLHTLLNVIAAYSTSWQMFAVMRFLIGVMIGAVLVMSVPYCQEFFPLKWRHTIPSIPVWPLGVSLFAGVAWLVEDWAYLHLGCAILGIPGLLGYFYIPESPRWLATRGREEEAYVALEKMARFNGRELPPTVEDTLKKIAAEEKATGKGKEYSYMDLFKNSDLTKISVIAGFMWCVMSLIFYGLSFAVTGFAGNLYLNIFLMSIVSLPGNVGSFFFVGRLGRRGTCLLFLGIAVTVSFVCVGLHLKDPLKGLTLAAGMLRPRCTSAAAEALAGIKLMQILSLGYGFCNTAARVGGILAPFVVNLEDLPLLSFILMGTMGAVSMVMTWFWPETRNKAMAETMFEKKIIATDLVGGNDLDPEKQASLGDLDPGNTPTDGPPHTIMSVNNDGERDVSFLDRKGDDSQPEDYKKTFTMTKL